jgi:hypothetical protein
MKTNFTADAYKGMPARMRWPLAEELRRQVDVECSGRGCPDATEILELLRDDIPRLNEARAAVMGAARD